MGFFEALRCWIGWLAKTLYYYMVEAVELIVDALAAVVNAILWLLPTFAIDKPELDSGVVGLLNYVVPIGPILSAFGILMGCWIVFRVYQWALKWGKAAD